MFCAVLFSVMLHATATATRHAPRATRDTRHTPHVTPHIDMINAADTDGNGEVDIDEFVSRA